MNLPAPAATEVAIPSLPLGWHVVNCTVLADGNLAIIGANVDVRAESRMGEPQEAARSARGQIWTFDATAFSASPAFPLLTPFPLLDRFPDGRWVVASARAYEDDNARILASHGEELRRIQLGDGIEHVQIDAAGNIWVGWFDEGVSGNEGWRVPGREWPPSSAGLAAFDEWGGIVASASDPAPGVNIADCYALNVTAEDAYACSYTDFPILKIGVGKARRYWPSKLTGTRALAVGPPYVLAVGGYGDEGDQAVLVRLGLSEAETVREWRMPFKLGYTHAVDLVDGRGEFIHAVREGVWHRWWIGDFISQVT